MEQIEKPPLKGSSQFPKAAFLLTKPNTYQDVRFMFQPNTQARGIGFMPQILAQATGTATPPRKLVKSLVEVKSLFDRAIASDSVATLVEDEELDTYSDDGWVSILLENSRAYVLDTPSSILREFTDQVKKLAGKGWAEIRRSCIFWVTPDRIDSVPDQKARPNNKEWLTNTYGGLSLEDLRSLEYRADAFIDGAPRANGYTARDFGTMIGIINILLFYRAEAFACFKRESAIAGAKCQSHIVGVDREKVIEMAGAEVSQVTAIAALIKFLKENWSSVGPRLRRATVLRLLNELQAAKYLEFSSKFELGVRGQSAVFTMLDVPGLLALAQQLEERIKESFDRVMIKIIDGQEVEIPCSAEGHHLPGHQGNSTRLLFNACFAGAGYGRGHYDRQPEDWELANEQREEDELRRRAAIAHTFLELDIEFDKALRFQGEGAARTVWLRRRRTQMLDRHRWLHQTLEDYKGNPEAFEEEDIEVVSRIKGAWHRIEELWEDRCGEFITGIDGVRRSLDEFMQDAWELAIANPRSLGRLHFDRVFG